MLPSGNLNLTKNKQVLKYVLASGQANFNHSSDKMRADVARMCEGVSVEEAAMFFGESDRQRKIGADGTESASMIRYFGQLKAEE